MRGVKILPAALAVLSLALVAWLPQRARAATCFGASCAYRDPFTTGCYVDADMVFSAPIYDTRTGSGQLGVVSLRWSTTCQAGYTQTTSWRGDAYSIMARTFGGYGGGAANTAKNATVVVSLMSTANSYCELFPNRMISMGSTTSSPWGAVMADPCP